MGSSGAFGELLLFAVYAVLILTGIILIILSLVIKGSKRKRISVCIVGITLIVLFFLYRNHLDSDRQLGRVGTYYLTDYPKCDSCIIVLTEDNLYRVLNGKEIVEAGNWHYENGGDAFIVYLNNKAEQLGAGKFKYKKYDLKYRGRK